MPLQPAIFVEFTFLNSNIPIFDKKQSDNIKFSHLSIGETTCIRAMKKSGFYRHYLNTCKKTYFVVSKAWNWSHLNSNVHNFFKFSFFFHNFEQNCYFFLPIAWLFCTNLNLNFSFLQLLSNFYNLGWNRGQFQTSFTETVHGFKKLSQFHWNWSQKKALFFVPFWHKIG